MSLPQPTAIRRRKLNGDDRLAGSRGTEDRAHCHQFYVAVGDDRWTGCVGKNFQHNAADTTAASDNGSRLGGGDGWYR